MKFFHYSIFVAAILSLVFTPLARILAIKTGFVDIPKDKRRMHKKPIPLLGGLAIYLGILIPIFIFMDLSKELWGLIIGSTLIFISGLIDDKRDLSPKAKMAFQFAGAIILVASGSRVEFFTNPFKFGESVIFLKIFSIPATIFWVVGITNTVNLIDGLDGLAAGVSAISALSLMIIAKELGYNDISLLAGLVAGACLGFLPYNFNPAKIFMGDAGALFLGFVLSYISIEGVMKSAAALTIFVPVLILGVPVFDTTFAMIRRKINGKSMVSADKGHLHHRLLRLGLSQRQTVMILYLISIIFGILANLVSTVNAKIGLFISVLVVIATIVLAFIFGMFKSKEE
ncbi:MraY family glycosyltransferase [Peptoniphilus catoniae]|uniref:MraY family glycosyltransferase n=1 Tax=Peptoniphilus catoniae TaxID=1660341 RepID=UPI0010FEB6F0|nr:MraY family glycosyltransferase [Peptoniphilus catoniae]